MHPNLLFDPVQYYFIQSHQVSSIVSQKNNNYLCIWFLELEDCKSAISKTNLGLNSICVTLDAQSFHTPIQVQNKCS